MSEAPFPPITPIVWGYGRGVWGPWCVPEQCVPTLGEGGARSPAGEGVGESQFLRRDRHCGTQGTCSALAILRLSKNLFASVKCVNAEKAWLCWVEILGRNLDKSLKRFPPCYSKSSLQLCLEILFLQTHAIFYSFFSALLYTVKEEGWKPDRKLHTLPYREFSRYAQKPQRNCTFMNSASLLASGIHCRCGTPTERPVTKLPVTRCPVYKTSSLYNAHLQKVQVTKSSVYKTSNYKTSIL